MAPVQAAIALGAKRLRDIVQGCVCNVATLFFSHLVRLKWLVRRRANDPATHTESVTRFASNGFSIIRFTCLFMAKDQFQSATTAHSYLTKHTSTITIPKKIG